MSTDRHPLDDALSDAEREGETYEVPVTLVRARVRRRRRARAAARGGVAALAVGAVAAVLPAVTAAPPATPPTSQRDWPEAFTRCGEPARMATASPDGDVVGSTDPVGAGDEAVEVTLEPVTTIGADRQAMLTTRVTFDPAEVASVHPSETEVVLVRDGVVVGVDGGGRVVVPMSELEPAPSDPGNALWSFGAVLESCAQYPGGVGAPRVPVGTYELVATETVVWSAHDGSQGSVRVRHAAPVEVTEAVPPVEAETCGADTASLAALTDADANPFHVAVDAELPRETPADGDLTLQAYVHNQGQMALQTFDQSLAVLLTRDGAVVATPSGRQATAPEVRRLEPQTTMGFEIESPLVGCGPGGADAGPGGDDGQPLPPGDYEVWVTIDLRLIEFPADGTPVHVLQGPWPLTLR
ncbi:hypothetical protein [Cellulomonas xiejunii]|uniref:hypothetical protein n=1 Tax=Cellulomonas xiejunii TaxID=2968083 RepID=UPI001D0DC770|nr:hypothetical protein [Cellulomonas xiejunii]MCC2315440.1 hypothetical protein [Cellulomonas xiejunii]